MGGEIAIGTAFTSEASLGQASSLTKNVPYKNVFSTLKVLNKSNLKKLIETFSSETVT